MASPSPPPPPVRTDRDFRQRCCGFAAISSRSHGGHGCVQTASADDLDQLDQTGVGRYGSHDDEPPRTQSYSEPPRSQHGGGKHRGEEPARASWSENAGGGRGGRAGRGGGKGRGRRRGREGRGGAGSAAGQSLHGLAAGKPPLATPRLMVRDHRGTAVRAPGLQFGTPAAVATR